MSGLCPSCAFCLKCPSFPRQAPLCHEDFGWNVTYLETPSWATPFIGASKGSPSATGQFRGLQKFLSPLETPQVEASVRLLSISLSSKPREGGDLAALPALTAVLGAG